MTIKNKKINFDKNKNIDPKYKCKQNLKKLSLSG